MHFTNANSLNDLGFVDEGGLFQVTPEEFQEKVANGKNWTVINDKVYEMEKFQRTHPGGSENIEDIIGKDGTELYMEAHEDSDSAHRQTSRSLSIRLKFALLQDTCQVSDRHA